MPALVAGIGGILMSIFYPDYSFRRVYEIPVRFFRQQGIEALLLDVDNTLTKDNDPVPHERVLDWLTEQKQAGLRLLVLSNNRRERVEPFAQGLGLDFIAEAKKPLPFRVWRELRRMGVPPKKTAVIGDQIFTDILCGRFSGCLSILVEYMEEEGYGFYVTKRRWEKVVLRNYQPRTWEEPTE